MTYYESAKGLHISKKRALLELKKHGIESCFGQYTLDLCTCPRGQFYYWIRLWRNKYLHRMLQDVLLCYLFRRQSLVVGVLDGTGRLAKFACIMP